MNLAPCRCHNKTPMSYGRRDHFDSDRWIVKCSVSECGLASEGKTQHDAEARWNEFNTQEPANAPQSFPGSIFQEAEQIIHGERRAEYGSVTDSFAKVAKIWSAITKTEITPAQVGLMMIALKLVRESNKHKRDNLVDIMGYAGLLEIINKGTK